MSNDADGANQRRSETMKRRYKDPEFRKESRQVAADRLAQLNSDPNSDFVRRRNAGIRAAAVRRIGHRNARTAWCPSEYIPEYSRLRERYGSLIAKEITLSLIDKANVQG